MITVKSGASSESPDPVLLTLVRVSTGAVMLMNESNSSPSSNPDDPTSPSPAAVESPQTRTN